MSPDATRSSDIKFNACILHGVKPQSTAALAQLSRKAEGRCAIGNIIASLAARKEYRFDDYHEIGARNLGWKDDVLKIIILRNVSPDCLQDRNKSNIDIQIKL